MKAEPGRVVSLYYDSPRAIEVGDEIVTQSGRRYEIVSWRRQTRGRHLGRKHIQARVLAPEHPVDPDITQHPIYWYSRTKR